MTQLTHRSTAFAACLLVGGFSSLAQAATYYVGPEGAGESCTRAAPCALGTGATLAQAGDTVVLLDGIYYEPLHPENSGRADAWITFQADECALPIIEGAGESAVDTAEGSLPSGVASNTGTYLRFVGIVSRYWDSGFTNGWTGKGTTNSNGHIEYINCIGDGNGRTGMAMYSAGGITIRECIATHNGGSPTDSWSSGIQLFAVQGTPEENIIERNVSFENTDAQNNSDGSGFIVDEECEGATFVNNLAFRNGGSCIRLTRVNNTRMVNFSCYHNGLNPAATGPTNPGEFYFTDDQSRATATLFNTIAAASGSEADPAALMFPPASGVYNNLTVDSGATPFYTDPEGVNPDFRPPASAAAQVENLGAIDGGPVVDIGFDPKCIIRRNPNVPFQKTWWQHSVDYDYIRSIGGVAQCFHPKARTGGVDIGAYELSGEPHAFSVPGSCVPSLEEPAPMGVAGAPGSGGTAGSDPVSVAGATGAGGAVSVAGAPSSDGTLNTGGAVSVGGAVSAAGATTSGGAVGAGGAATTGGLASAGSAASTAGTAVPAAAGSVATPAGSQPTVGAAPGTTASPTGSVMPGVGTAVDPLAMNTSSAGAVAAAGSVPAGVVQPGVASAGAAGAAPPAATEPEGCACRVVGAPRGGGPLRGIAITFFALLGLVLYRRR